MIFILMPRYAIFDTPLIAFQRHTAAADYSCYCRHSALLPITAYAMMPYCFAAAFATLLMR